LKVLSVQHTTTYRYRRPVRFGEHRAMLRPRDSHDLRLLNTALVISPTAKVRWYHDVFSNSVMIASFEEEASELRVDSRIRLAHYGNPTPERLLEPFAETYPFCYPSDQIPDLSRTTERHYADPQHLVENWAKEFLRGRGSVGTTDLLLDITQAIRTDFKYAERTAHGTQSPVETLESRSGSCRDFALLMMETVRSLGLAARFVSGYLYDPALDGEEATTIGAGATHAWVQVFLPGAGWVEYDPTNGSVGGNNLIRVAVARDPSQALPLQGTYIGEPEDFLGMDVEVVVRSDEPEPAESA